MMTFQNKYKMRNDHIRIYFSSNIYCFLMLITLQSVKSEIYNQLLSASYPVMYVITVSLSPSFPQSSPASALHFCETAFLAPS